jgi:hypothetical protein
MFLTCLGIAVIVCAIGACIYTLRDQRADIEAAQRADELAKLEAGYIQVAISFTEYDDGNNGPVMLSRLVWRKAAEVQ